MKDSNPTLKNIAEKVGFSVSTVSRVLNGKGDDFRICKKTQELILNTAKNMNFKANQLARGLRIQKTMAIGLVIPDISNPFFSTIAKNIEHEARKNGYTIILCDTEENTKLEKHSIEMLQMRKVDGLIISTVGQDNRHLLSVYQQGKPMVIVDRVFPDLGIPFVATNNYKGAFDATSYFIKNGHNVIACIQGLPDTYPNAERKRGYIDAHKKFNLPIDKSLIVGDSYGKKNGYLQTKLLLNLKKMPTAIFACSNLISLGALQAISDEKMKVPEDISIISFDDQPYSNLLATPMTTVMQKAKNMGKIAVYLLLNQLNSKSYISSNAIYLPTKLIIRKSVKNLNLDIPNNIFENKGK